MNDPYVTEQTKRLHEALGKLGIDSIVEYNDGHKHVDIAIVSARIFIEVDGLHHFTDPKQIEADFKRNHYSDGDDFDTIHIPNIIIQHHCDEVAAAIAKVISSRQSGA
jgi:very-short-patch-repair endonuclease